jgi:hypothetical protein
MIAVDLVLNLVRLIDGRPTKLFERPISNPPEHHTSKRLFDWISKIIESTSMHRHYHEPHPPNVELSPVRVSPPNGTSQHAKYPLPHPNAAILGILASRAA